MSSSTPNLDLISSSQAQKEVAANELFLSGSPATAFSRRRSTSSGLTWGYYGTQFRKNDGSFVNIPNGTVTLVDSATNYLEVDKDTGAIVVGTGGFSPSGTIPLYSVVVAGGAPTSWLDFRQVVGEGTQGEPGPPGSLSTVLQITASVTLDKATHSNKFLDCSHATTPIVVTVSPDSSGLWDENEEVHVRWAGVAAVSITQGSGVTIQYPASNTLNLAEQYAAVTLKRVDVDTWALFGALELAP